MSLWADYLKERLGQDSIERDFGFLVYKVQGIVCEICELYVSPAVRSSGRGRELVSEVIEIAKQQNCVTLIAYVWPGLPGSESVLSSSFKFGFQLAGADAGRIMITKDLGG